MSGCNAAYLTVQEAVKYRHEEALCLRRTEIRRTRAGLNNRGQKNIKTKSSAVKSHSHCSGQTPQKT